MSDIVLCKSDYGKVIATEGGIWLCVGEESVHVASWREVGRVMAKLSPTSSQKDTALDDAMGLAMGVILLESEDKGRKFPSKSLVEKARELRYKIATLKRGGS